MSRWPMVRLGEVLVQRKDVVSVDPTVEYPMAGVYSFGKGLFFRGVKLGQETSYKEFYRLHAGDLVLSRVKGWEGAIGIVPDSLDGHFVSKEFPSFSSPDGQLDTRFLGYFFSSRAGQDSLVRAAQGIGARRERVKEKEFLEIEVPLPGAGEQREIVKTIGRISRRVENALKIRDGAQRELDSMLLAMTTGNPGHPRRRVGDYVEWIRDTEEVTIGTEYRFAGVKSFGNGVFLSGTKSSRDFKHKRVSRLSTRDFIYPKLMAWEGAFGMVPQGLDGTVVSTEFQVFRCTEKSLLPEVLDVYFRSPVCLDEVRSVSTGTNVRRRRLRPEKFLELLIPVPPERIQSAIRKLFKAREKLTKLSREHKSQIRRLPMAAVNEAFTKWA